MQMRVARYIFKIFSHPELNSKAVLKQGFGRLFPSREGNWESKELWIITK